MDSGKRPCFPERNETRNNSLRIGKKQGTNYPFAGNYFPVIPYKFFFRPSKFFLLSERTEIPTNSFHSHRGSIQKKICQGQALYRSFYTYLPRAKQGNALVPSRRTQWLHKPPPSLPRTRLGNESASHPEHRPQGKE